MDIDDFLCDHIDEKAFDQPNFLFWVRTVCDAMSFIGPETDPDLERMIRQLQDHHAGAVEAATVIDNMRHEIVRLRGVSYWGDSTPLGLKYRCLNAVASTRTKILDFGNDNWQYGVVTAFQLINHDRDKDQILIQFIREKAREQGAELYENQGGNGI